MNLSERAQKLVIFPQKPRDFHRPPHAEEVIRGTLNSSNCRHCGECCRGRTYPIPTINGEAERIRKYLRAKGATTNLKSVQDGYLEVPHGQCAMLQSNHGAFTCSVYQFRPSACSSFPFNPATPASFSGFDRIAQEMLQASSKWPSNMIGITASCPPFLKLAEQGITYLLLSDITGPNQPRFLESTLLWLDIMLSRSLVSLPQVFIEDKLQPFIPLLHLPASVVIANNIRRISGFYPKPSETP